MSRALLAVIAVGSLVIAGAVGVWCLPPASATGTLSGTWTLEYSEDDGGQQFPVPEDVSCQYTFDLTASTMTVGYSVDGQQAFEKEFSYIELPSGYLSLSGTSDSGQAVTAVVNPVVTGTTLDLHHVSFSGYSRASSGSPYDASSGGPGATTPPAPSLMHLVR